VERATRKEVQRQARETLLIKAVWEVQINRVNERISEAQNALTVATNEIVKPDTLPSKNAYIQALEQANIGVNDALVELESLARPITVSQECSEDWFAIDRGRVCFLIIQSYYRLLAFVALLRMQHYKPHLS
jgi:hypothetical protein